jgi:hypothetical protein
MGKCGKCGKTFKGKNVLCPDCEAEVCTKIAKGRKIFNQHGFEASIKYDADKARYECTNRDGFWISYNGENWIQAVPAKSLSNQFRANPALETDTKGVELSDEYQHNHLQEALDYALKNRGFIKADSGKLQWSLLPFEELKDVVRVLMLGAKKYTPDNWKKCDDVTRYKDALMRHVISYVSGDTTDDESGLSHLAHAVCNCLFLMYFDNTQKEK